MDSPQIQTGTQERETGICTGTQERIPVTSRSLCLCRLLKIPVTPSEARYAPSVFGSVKINWLCWARATSARKLDQRGTCLTALLRERSLGIPPQFGSRPTYRYTGTAFQARDTLTGIAGTATQDVQTTHTCATSDMHMHMHMHMHMYMHMHV